MIIDLVWFVTNVLLTWFMLHTLALLSVEFFVNMHVGVVSRRYQCAGLKLGMRYALMWPIVVYGRGDSAKIEIEFRHR